MSPSFNLVEEPWVPCVSLDGGVDELGLREALVRAHELRELSDPSPLVTAALHRLLLAVLHRVFGPRTREDWAKLWREGRFPVERLNAYLREWRHRFDLFDPDRPFYQVPDLEETDARSASSLLQELASGNNATLFDHTHDESDFGMPAAVVARALVAYHAFAARSIESGGKDRYVDQAPLVKGAVTLVRGADLFRTLMLNLHRYEPREGEPFHVRGTDLPAWERGKGVEAGDRAPNGYLDLLTWQSRRIRLFPELHHDGRVAVRRVCIMKGGQFRDSFSLQGHETMLSFKRRTHAQGRQEPWRTIAFEEDRAIWRDSLALCQSAEATAQPKTLSWLRELLEAEVLDRRQALLIDLLGLSTDRANILLWRHERLALPAAYLEDAQIRSKLREALHLTEDVAAALARTADRLARTLVAPGQRKPRAEDVRPVREHLGVERAYWSRLDRPFRHLLLDLAQDRTEDTEGRRYGEKALPWWAGVLKRIARDSLTAATSGLEASSKGMKAVALAERQLGGELRGLLQGYLPVVQEVEA